MRTPADFGKRLLIGSTVIGLVVVMLWRTAISETFGAPVAIALLFVLVVMLATSFSFIQERSFAVRRQGSSSVRKSAIRYLILGVVVVAISIATLLFGARFASEVIDVSADRMNSLSTFGLLFGLVLAGWAVRRLASH